MRNISFAIFALIFFYTCKESKNQFIDYQQINRDFENKSSIELKEVKSNLDSKSNDVYTAFLQTMADTVFTNYKDKNLVELIDSVFSKNPNHI